MTILDTEREALEAQLRAEIKAEMQAAQTIVPALQEPVIRLQVDTTKLTIGDQELLLRLGGTTTNDASALILQADAIALLDRIVVGGVKHLPLAELPDVMAQVTKALNRAGDRTGN